MKRPRRSVTTVILFAALAAIVFGATLLRAGAEWSDSQPAAAAAPERPPSPVAPLPDFRPSEELPADAAVAFPTDI